MRQPSSQPTPPPTTPPPTPHALPSAPKGRPPLTLWHQLAPGHQRQLSQQVAELIRRIRQQVNPREGQHDGVHRLEP
jgi:hypothetical protein